MNTRQQPQSPSYAGVTDAAIERVAQGLFRTRHPAGDWSQVTDTQYDLFRIEARAAIVAMRAADTSDGEVELPCDVRLPPATTVRAGCKLSTLIHALELRGMKATSTSDGVQPHEVERMRDLLGRAIPLLQAGRQGAKELHDEIKAVLGQVV